MPRSTMSAESSGGVRSSADAHRVDDHVDRLGQRLADLLVVMVSVFGTPSIRSRPLISIVIGSSSG
jgi:hypothetical protein